MKLETPAKITPQVGREYYVYLGHEVFTVVCVAVTAQQQAVFRAAHGALWLIEPRQILAEIPQRGFLARLFNF